jgi:hypothetical protein
LSIFSFMLVLVAQQSRQRVRWIVVRSMCVEYDLV